jgi:hypothetical protein
MILDDMFQPLSIIRQGYRSVLDPRAYVYDTWPKKIKDEFHRKVRTLAGNFQLFYLAPWTLSPRNPVFFQLFSHKVMRLAAPYLLVLLAPLRGVCRCADFRLGPGSCRPALQGARAASNRSSGQCAAGARSGRRRRVVQVSFYARAPVEDMEFKQAVRERCRL